MSEKELSIFVVKTAVSNNLKLFQWGYFSKMGNKEDCHVFQIMVVKGIISNSSVFLQRSLSTSAQPQNEHLTYRKSYFMPLENLNLNLVVVICIVGGYFYSLPSLGSFSIYFCPNTCLHLSGRLQLIIVGFPLRCCSLIESPSQVIN